jgi:hypothetical protein
MRARRTKRLVATAALSQSALQACAHLVIALLHQERQPHCDFVAHSYVHAAGPPLRCRDGCPTSN